jgi:hypothetical protein
MHNVENLLLSPFQAMHHLHQHPLTPRQAKHCRLLRPRQSHQRLHLQLLQGRKLDKARTAKAAVKYAHPILLSIPEFEQGWSY